MAISIKIKSLNIGEKKYFTVNQMSALTNKSSQTIYGLINLGNAVRRMRSIKIADRVLIPTEELIEFPFTYSGAHPKDNIYYYDKEGRIIKKEESSE